MNPLDPPLPSLDAWRKMMHDNTGQKISGLQLGTWLRQALVTLPTELGRSAQEVSRSRRWPSAATSGLFPLSPSMLEAEGRVRARLRGLDPQAVGDWAWVLAVLLNYLADGMVSRRGVGKAAAAADLRGGVLAESRRIACEHLVTRILWYLEEDNVDDWAKIYSEAKLRKVSYQGEAVSVRRNLEWQKVIPPWLAVGKAAVHPILDSLDPSLRSVYADPRACLLPREEWPQEVHKSRVYSTQEDWDLIAQAGLERGIFWTVKEEEVFRAPDGTPVLNGAMGVDKIKETPTGTLELLRFISILTPINQYMRLLSGDAKLLPYLGHALLILLGEGEDMLVDSEDLESCFNLWYQPDSWKGFTAVSYTHLTLPTTPYV